MFASIVGQLILGWLIADFLGGLFHWWEDRVGTVDLPFVGSWIIRPNRDHHADPLLFCRGTTFFDRNLALIVTSAVIGGAWIALFGLSVGIVATVIGGALTNEVHAWAHQPSRAPRWARVLQDIGFIQSPKQHAGHHRPPQDKSYCILTDWLNPILDALRLWDRLEAGLARIGMEPNRGTR